VVNNGYVFPFKPPFGLGISKKGKRVPIAGSQMAQNHGPVSNPKKGSQRVGFVHVKTLF
jgi:hypothetical protein